MVINEFEKEINEVIDEYRASLDADIILKVIEKRIDKLIEREKKPLVSRES